MSAKVEKILGSLTLEEKVSLLAGKDFWETVPIPEKGVPAIKVCITGSLNYCTGVLFVLRYRVPFLDLRPSEVGRSVKDPIATVRDD